MNTFATFAQYPGYRFGVDGSVWSCWTKTRIGRKGSRSFMGTAWRQLKPMLNQGGYAFVNIRTASGVIKRNALIHQLILLAFRSDRPSCKHEVCHADGVKTNNALSNLRWGTRKENAAAAIRHGTIYRGGSNRTSDTKRQWIDLLGSRGISFAWIALALNVSLSTIKRVRRKSR